MKTLFDGTMEIITPCFCAGANQAKAEIRAPSIRGELRWWFRALGGTREQEARKQEARVFGSIKSEKAHTENQASSLVVRVSQQKEGAPIRLPSMKMGAPLTYLLYFANASGKARGVQYGPRFQQEGILPPESTFQMQIILRKPLAGDDEALLVRAIELLEKLGTIGYRGRRACGAWCANVESVEEFRAWAKAYPEICIAWPLKNGTPQFCSDWFSAMQESEIQLKEFRRSGYSAKKSTPLGLDNPRQASAVRFRPVRLAEGFLPVVVYTDYALSDTSQDSGFRVAGKVIGDSILTTV